MSNKIIISSEEELVGAVLIGTAILFENTILILVISTSTKLHSTKYIFTASMGVIDMLVGLSTLFVGVFDYTFWKSLWASFYIPSAMASLINGSMIMLSIVHMAVISVERYLFIAHPFFYLRRLTPRAIRWIVATLWLVGVAHVAALTLILESVSEEFPLFPMRFMPLFLKLGFFWIPYGLVTIITCLFYTLILALAIQRRRSIRSLGVTVHVSRWNELAKSLKFFLTVFGIYFLLTCPYYIYDMSDRDNGFLAGNESVVVFLMTLNSGTNFLVLLVMDELFRQTIKTKLCILKAWVTVRCVCV